MVDSTIIIGSLIEVGRENMVEFSRMRTKNDKGAIYIRIRVRESTIDPDDGDLFCFYSVSILLFFDVDRSFAFIVFVARCCLPLIILFSWLTSMVFNSRLRISLLSN